MKTIFLLAGTGILCLFCYVGKAQVNDPNQVAKDATTNQANNDMNNAAQNGINKTENALKGVFKKKNKNAAAGQQPTTNTTTAASAPGSTAPASTQTVNSYKNYDFVPGDTIIFQSQLADERAGEIPSQFTVEHGQMDVQMEEGEQVIHVPKGEGAIMNPRMTNQTYMPDQFTVEFDFKNDNFGVAHLNVDFGNRVYYSGGEGLIPGLSFGSGTSVAWTLGDVEFPDGLDLGTDKAKTWHHIAVAINKNQGKVYIDQYRVANVNNLTGKANNVTIDVNGYENSYIKNIRVAKGGIDVYKKATTLTKIITHGILFDIDKASIEPPSMGTINEIYNLLKQDPSLKFEIDGHTDNSGNTAHNLTLSQQRADAVKDQLTTMGIDPSRLTAKGFGDTKPIDNNNTPEGKANNRRVEFVKK
jgi:OmpA-OmpF porin, OOP family